MYTAESSIHGQNFRHVPGNLMKQVTYTEGFLGITAAGHSIHDPCSTNKYLTLDLNISGYTRDLLSHSSAFVFLSRQYSHPRLSMLLFLLLYHRPNVLICQYVC